MAEENLIQTNIVANANFAPLIADLNKVTLALSGLQEKLNASNKMLATNVAVMNKAFAETLRSTGQFSTHFVSLTSDVDKFGSQLDKGQIKLGQFFRVYREHAQTSGGIIRDLAKQQVQLQNAILQPLGRNAEGLMQYNVHIPRGLDVVKNKTALVKQELQIMNKVVQEGAGQLINWGKNTQWAGRQLTVGLTVPMVAFGKAAADAFKTADQELVRLTKVYGGLSATSAVELQKVRKDVAATATQLSKTYGASFQETLGLAADIAATGKQGNELLGSVAETTRLAVLGEVDRQEAMKATLAIQTAFKQNTAELSESINFLNAVENQTSTTLQDLVEAIPKAGPVVKGLGGSIKDLSLYLTAMKEGGISAAEGANALKSGLAALINPTKVATNMFANFGIDLKGIVTRNAGNLTQTILDLQSALDTLNPLQKQQALEQLFGKFQFARMNALFSNLGKQGSQTLQVLDLMKASSQDLANIAGRELSQVTESASGKYKRALEGLKADLAGIGDQFLTINTTLIKFVDGIIKISQALPDPIKKVLGFIGILTAGLGPIVMLTGVLGNFFGYVIKGAYHFKALFKGAEGWKLLTPEILAANKAGSLAEQTFYSDAKAAAILNQSLQALIGSYKALEAQVSSGVISTTILPQTGAAGLMRQVNTASPFLSPKDTRSMSHLNPVAGMTMQQKLSQTMFGVVPGAPIVNAKIGKVPQMYMEEDLPRIQGISAVGKVSTGVVAQEAAQWHAMTAALGMQSKPELAKLKKEVAATGTITAELSQAYDALLPKMNEITTKAAQASKIIVEDLRANKINANEARAKITALNAEIEQLMVQAANQVASDLGRNINVTQVPMLNQPVVDPRTGKSNMKELLKKGRTRDLLNKIARGLGVKTYGAAYSIETTIPKRMNLGGYISRAVGHYGNLYNPEQHGAVVPGPNVNYDIIPSNVPVGGFVLNQQASRANPNLVALAARGYQGGGQLTPAMLTPGETVVDPNTYLANKEAFDTANRMALGGNIKASRTGYGRDAGLTYLLNRLRTNIGGPRLTSGSVTGSPKDIFSILGITRPGRFTSSGILVGPRGGKMVSVSAKPATAIYGARLAKMPINPQTGKPHTLKSLNELLAKGGLKGEELDAWLGTLGYMAQGGPLIGTTTQFLNSIPNVNPQISSKILQEIDDQFYKEIARFKNNNIPLTDTNNPYHRISNDVISKYFAPGSEGMHYWNQFKYKTSGLNPLYLSDVLRGAGHSSSAGYQNIVLSGPNGESVRVGRVKGSKNDTMAFHAANEDWQSQFGFNSGGRIPGYGLGGVLSKAGVLKKLGAIFSVNQGGRGYTVNALPRYVNTKAFDMLPISLKAKKFLYGALVDDVTRRSPKSTGSVQYGPLTSYGRASKTVKGFGGKDRDDIWQSVSSVLKNNPNLSESDRAFFAKVNSNEQQMPWFVARGLGMNRGGRVPGYIRGGGILGSMLMSTAGYFGGSALGGMLGGQTGSMIGGFLGSSFGGVGGMRKPQGPEEQFMAIDKAYNRSIIPVTKWKDALAETAFTGGKFSSTLSRMVLGLSKTNLALGAVTTAGVIAYKMWKSHQEQLDRTHKSYGLTAETAGKLGLKFKDYNSEIKNSIANFKALQERGRMAYESLSSSGTPLNMTIEQYKKLREEVSKTMTDQINMINKAKVSDLGGIATRLKQQFVNAGMSAEEAAKKIYTAFQVSNKAQYAGQATFGNAAFSSIINAKTSAVSSLQSFGAAAKQRDAVSQANALNNALTGVDAAIQEIIADDKKMNKGKKDALTEYQAQAKLQDLINTKVGKQATLTSDVIKELAKTNPEILNFANNTDTVLSLWQKMRLAASGFAADLSGLNAAQTNAIYTIQQQYTSIFAAENRSGALKGQYTQLDKYKAQMAALAKAVKGQTVAQQQSAQDRIKQLQKEIDLINKNAEARKKALQEQQQDEDALTQIKKKQLEYQDALAAGNMSAAAQAQLDIRSLTGQQQRVLAERAIDAKAAAQIAPKQAEIEKIQNAQNAIAAAAAKAAESLDSVTTKYNSLKQKLDDAATALANYKVAVDYGIGDLKTARDNLTAAGKALGITPTGTTSSPDVVGGKMVPGTTSSETMADYLAKYFKSSEIKADTIIINAAKILDSKNQPGPSVTSQVYSGARGLSSVSYRTTVEGLKTFQIPIEEGQQFTSGGQTWKITSKPDSSGRVYVQKVQGKEFGGDVKAGVPYLVGEKRPELFIPNTNGTIIPNIPKFLNGINNVPYDMQAILHKGEAVLSPSKAMSMDMDSGYTINVGNVTMSFPETPTNGKELFAQFKQALQLENIKSGGRVRLIQ